MAVLSFSKRKLPTGAVGAIHSLQVGEHLGFACNVTATGGDEQESAAQPTRPGCPPSSSSVARFRLGGILLDLCANAVNTTAQSAA